MVNSFHFQVPIGPVKAFKQRKLLVPIHLPLNPAGLLLYSGESTSRHVQIICNIRGV